LSETPEPEQSELVTTIGSMRANAHIVDAATSPIFTPDECAAILDACDEALWQRDVPSTAISAPRQKVEQPLPGGNTGWVGERIAQRVVEINDDLYGFRLVGLEEGIQVSAYHSDGSGSFGRHGDLYGGRSMRKLTFSVLLSDPATFVGGDLTFVGGPLAAGRALGVISVFPSFLPHEVTRVTEGCRITIVGWAVGPTFV
jgi:predicted 2-oxoglutarate/Fe(II)-dependent dioxygenase YbiX